MALEWLKTMQREITEKEEATKTEFGDKELTTAITGVFGDKKFTSDYVRNGLISDMKAEISKIENKGNQWHAQLSLRDLVSTCSHKGYNHIIVSLCATIRKWVKMQQIDLCLFEGQLKRALPLLEVVPL